MLELLGSRDEATGNNALMAAAEGYSYPFEVILEATRDALDGDTTKVRQATHDGTLDRVDTVKVE